MPIGRRDLHDLLDERSLPALERSIPWESLRSRTRAARRRRRTMIAVAGVATAASVAVAGTLVARPEPPKDEEITASSPHQLPSSYEEKDGTVYRRLATAVFDPEGGRPVSFDVPVTGRPLAVMADCPTASMSSLQVTARVPGTSKQFGLTPVPFLMHVCDDHRPTDVEPLPTGTRRATFTIRRPKVAGRPAEPARTWRFAVYEWTPPATMRPAPPPVAPPAGIGDPPEHTLLTTRSVTWPATREVTVAVPHTGRTLAMMTYCGGGIGGRLTEEVWVNGRRTKIGIRCDNPPSERGGSYVVLGAVRPDADGNVSIRVKVSSVISDYERRPGVLTVAVYDTRSQR
ncbi:hypothetical protein [Nonomuraea sp. NPDC050643]|uniref:hypothetical protein n=1 Tax=Nonomuraea sp. NPDC050643 TaxID=3155660 RepID=UPI0033F079AA